LNNDNEKEFKSKIGTGPNAVRITEAVSNSGDLVGDKILTARNDEHGQIVVKSVRMSCSPMQGAENKHESGYREVTYIAIQGGSCARKDCVHIS
jgi:hypothetical protein